MGAYEKLEKMEIDHKLVISKYLSKIKELETNLKETKIDTKKQFFKEK